MAIDWFTVIAQILNFLVLVWLLKRFLYQPVLDAVDAREKKITSQLQEAEEKKAQARLERDKYQQLNTAFDLERAGKMEVVREDVTLEKQRLFDEIKQESKALRQRYEASLIQEAEQMTGLLKQKVQEEVFAIAHKTLNDMADASLEERMVNVFVSKIQHLSGQERNDLVDALMKDEKMIIKSAFKLSENSRSQLNELINEITGKPIRIQYDNDPGLVSGIAIHTDRYSLSWNIDAYLDDLRKDIIESLPHQYNENAAL